MYMFSDAVKLLLLMLTPIQCVKRQRGDQLLTRPG